ncbi:MAG: M20/M25/M40 family metallo-hydrolase [Vicinamibacterales bacterium]
MRCHRLSRLALACSLAIVLALPVFAEPTKIKVDGSIIKGYITHLASDAAQGRRTLTPGYEKAAEWAAAKFKEWGLKPAGENGTFFQNVPMTGARSAFVWTTGIPSLVINGRTFYHRDGSFAVDMASTPGAKAAGGIVFVGYGISAPAKGLDEYAGVDVKGRIVLALKGSPTTAPTPRVQFAPAPAPEAPRAPGAKDEWAEEAADNAKVKTAYAKGAAAIMLYNPDPAPAGGRGMMGGMGARGEALDPAVFTRPFIYVSNVDESVLRWVLWRDPQESLRGFTARFAGMRADIKGKKPRSAATGVTAALKGYDMATRYGEQYKNNVGRNVIAKIEGTDTALKAQYVIAGGHLDHVGVTNGVIFNGADDNASGSAVTMEVARLLAANNVKPKRTLIFALWTGEEQGLLGSQYYSDHPPDGVTMDSTVAYFNMDMVGLGDRIGAPGALNFPSIFDVIMKDQDPEIAKRVDASQAGPGGSDYSAFMERGIEALGLMTSGRGGHPDYHDAGDDPAKMEADILGWTGQFVLQGMLSLADETSVTLLIPDRLVQYQSQRFTPPDISGATERSWQHVRASTHDELMTLLAQRLRASSAAPQGIAVMGGGRGGGGGRVTTGVRGAGIFQGSTATLEAAAAALNFGRVDVMGPDGAWFGDRLTPAGKTALGVMEASAIAVNLVRPPASLLADVLGSAKRPIMVTGLPPMDAALLETFKKNNALAVLECDPADVDGCVRHLNALKDTVGKSNVLLSVGAHKDRAAATSKLFLAAVKAGWTKDELFAAAGQAAGRGGPGAAAPNNLTRFGGATAARPF